MRRIKLDSEMAGGEVPGQMQGRGSIILQVLREKGRERY